MGRRRQFGGGGFEHAIEMEARRTSLFYFSLYPSDSVWLTNMEVEPVLHNLSRVKASTSMLRSES